MSPTTRNLWLVIGGLVLLSLALAFFISPYASQSPDGLNKVAEDQGFSERGEEGQVWTDKAPAPEYVMPGIKDPKLAKGLAGAAGTLGVLLLALAIGKLLRLRRKQASASSTTPA